MFSSDTDLSNVPFRFVSFIPSARRLHSSYETWQNSTPLLLVPPPKDGWTSDLYEFYLLCRPRMILAGTQLNGGLDSPSAVSSGPNGRQGHAGMTGLFSGVLVRGHLVLLTPEH